jgi:hypothetical protein
MHFDSLEKFLEDRGWTIINSGNEVGWIASKVFGERGEALAEPVYPSVEFTLNVNLDCSVGDVDLEARCTVEVSPIPVDDLDAEAIEKMFRDSVSAPAS